MGMRAVTTVIDHTCVPRRFWSAWASPEYQIPHLATFLTWADQHHGPLTIDTYLRYGAEHPGTLPVQDVTDAFADEERASDLDYRYHLTLDADTRDVTLTVRNMRRRRRRDRVVVETITRASLYDAAARMCELVATRCQQWADTNNGHHLPGGDPAQWRAAAADFRTQQATPAACDRTPATAQTTPADTGPGRTRRARLAAPEHEPAADPGYHDVVTERSVVALGMSREQFHGLAPALGLPPTWFGRFKGCPGERRDIHLNSGASSCLTEAGLDAAIGYLRAHRLAYEQTTTVRHEPIPSPAEHPDPEGTSR